MPSEYLYIDDVKDKGRGVFTHKKIASGVIIETAPVIVLSPAERTLLDQTLLHDYIFVWGENKEQCCVALGYISIYNHSFQANCEYFMEYDRDRMYIKSVRTIKAGEELTINYNGDWNNTEKLWFESKG